MPSTAGSLKIMRFRSSNVTECPLGVAISHRLGPSVRLLRHKYHAENGRGRMDSVSGLLTLNQKSVDTVFVETRKTSRVTFEENYT